MKKIFFSFVMIIAAFSSSAQSEKFTKAMLANITKLDSAKTADEYLSVAAGFERIANAEKNQWLAYYYAAYGQALYGFVKQNTESYDNIADKAAALLNSADSLQKDNSEISCVKSMIATLHLLVNPYQRYMEYGPISTQALDLAKKQDPTNPRPYYLTGQTLKNTPEQFGGGCKTAKPVLEQAIQLYDAFKPVSEIYPHWGRKTTEDNLAACK
ncbi:MAG: hypothetical protein ABJA78_16185 [Ferruginibacter sp.]